MTGFTSRGVLSQKLRHDYVSLSDILGRALVDAGHEVEAGRFLPDDDPDDFDCALILVYWVSSLSSHYAHEAALALARFGPRAVCYVDDWRSQTLADDYQNHVERPVGWDRHRNRFRKDLWDRLSDEEVDAGRRALLSFIDPSQGLEAPTIIVPQHPWGDLSRWQVGGRELLSPLVPLDPTPGVPLPELTGRPGKRRREWVLASIQEHDRWLASLDLSWPVRQLGGAKKLGGGVNPGSAEMGKVVPEREVVQAYADGRGMLVPPYACDGSGWWRPRYTFAAHARAVTYAPPGDAAALGGPFLYEPSDYEAMSDEDLDAVAEAQAEEQESRAWDYARMQRTLTGTLEKAASR